MVGLGPLSVQGVESGDSGLLCPVMLWWNAGAREPERASSLRLPISLEHVSAHMP